MAKPQERRRDTGELVSAIRDNTKAVIEMQQAFAVHLAQDAERQKAYERQYKEQEDNQKAITDCQKAIIVLSEQFDAEKIRVDGLNTRVNGWSSVNSLGVLIAGIIAFFRGS